MDNSSFYDVLGVSADAEPEVIEAAYRALRLKYHPDRVGGDVSAQRRAQEISAAFNTLSNAEKRRRYDQERAGSGRHLTVRPPPTPADKQAGRTSAAIRDVETPAADTKLCPHCAEHIKKDARVCRYCGLNVVVSQQEPPQAQPHTTIYNNINAHPQPTTTVTETYTVKPRGNEAIKGCLLAAAILEAFFLIIVALGASAVAPETEIGASPTTQPALASTDVCTPDNEHDGQFWGEDGRPWILAGGECRLVEDPENADLAQRRGTNGPDPEAASTDNALASARSDGAQEEANLKPAQSTGVLPKTFQGSWASSKAECLSGIERVEVQPSSIDYYEARGSMKSVVPGINDSEYIASISFEGEGDKWENVTSFRLIGQKLAMTDRADNGQWGDATVWERCP